MQNFLQRNQIVAVRKKFCGVRKDCRYAAKNILTDIRFYLPFPKTGVRRVKFLQKLVW